MGRVLLANKPEAETRAMLKKHPPTRRTERSVTDTDKLIRILNKVRTQGYAINDQEIELGLRSIAVPLHDSRGHVVAALNTGVAAVQDVAMKLKEIYLDKLLAVLRFVRPLLV
jgi:IclR family pca regulon transcriptional regulator